MLDDLMDDMEATAKQHTQDLGKIEGFTDEQAEELYKIVGLGALKYFLLKVDPRKRILFDPEESIQFHGNTGPFIQYTHARIKAILRKSNEMGINTDQEKITNNIDLLIHEKDAIYLLSLYEDRINEAAGELSPATIAQYVFDLAKSYNKFYQEVSIFNEPHKAKLVFRIALSSVVARTISAGMTLMGIDVPERM